MVGFFLELSLLPSAFDRGVFGVRSRGTGLEVGELVFGIDLCFLGIRAESPLPAAFMARFRFSFGDRSGHRHPLRSRQVWFHQEQN